MSIKKNNAAGRTLSAIFAETDDEEVQSDLNEMVASDEGKENKENKENKETVEDVMDEEKEEEPEEVEAYKKDHEDSSDDDDDEDDEDDDEPEVVEVEDDEEVSDDGEDNNDEVEEITEEEVEAYKKDHEDSSDDEDDDEPEVVEVEDDEEEVNDGEPEEITEEEIDEGAATEAISCLIKNGFTCFTDDSGKISVTACGGEVEGCGDKEECEECKEGSVTLRPVTDDEKVEAEDVCSVLSGAETDQPFYTVLIKGLPVAAIYLKDQPNAEAIRAYFLSNTYPEKLARAMATGGVKNVLDAQKAHMFVAEASKSELAKSMKAEAKAEFDEQIAQAVISAKDKFINAVKLAVAGINKNFFTEDNNLKAAAFASFKSLGCDESVAVAKTEDIFAQANSYFDTVIAKAQELMGKSDEAFEEISEMVASAGVAQKATKTFASALQEGNNPIIASMQQEQTKVKASVDSIMKTKKLFGRRP